MRDLVIGVTVTLPDGTRASSGGKVVKNVAGYDLGKLFCGSRGRLGSVERLALRLHPRPAASAHGRRRRRPLGARSTTRGLVPSAVDIVGDRMLVLFEGGSGRRRRAGRRSSAARTTEPWAEVRALQAGLHRRVRWDGGAAPLVRPGPRVAYVEGEPDGDVEPARRARRRCARRHRAARADRRLRPLRLLPADVPDLLALARGDGLAARPHPPDGRASSTARSPLTDTVVEHFDRCLGCMACVPACPSGVQYDRLIETTRAHIEQHHRRTPGERLLRRLIFEVFPHRRRLRAALALRRLPAPGPFAPLAAVAPPWRSARLAARAPAGRRAARRAVAGCVQSVVFGDVNAATARVLAADGYDVHVPRAQGCCGALHAHAGRLDEGVARAHELARRPRAATTDRHERRRLRLAPEGPRHPERRRRVGAARRPAGAGRAAAARRCASRSRTRATSGMRSASRPSRARRCRRSPGSCCSSRAEQELCCGSAGIYNLVQPDGGARARRPQGDARARDRAGRVRERQSRAASCRSRRRSAAPAGRWRRSTRSSSSTRRSAASTRRPSLLQRAASGSTPRAPRPRRRRGRSRPRRATGRSRPAGAPSRHRRCTTRARRPRRDRPSRRRRASSTPAR